MTRFEPLPGVLGEIADVAGEDAACAVAQEYGGVRVYFPKDCSQNHWLAELVGHKAAILICRHFAGDITGININIPLGFTSRDSIMRRRIYALIDEGRSYRDIALMLRINQRTVERVGSSQKTPKNTDQLDMFGG